MAAPVRGWSTMRRHVAMESVVMVLALLCLLQMPLTGGFDIKSMQVYSEKLTDSNQAFAICEDDPRCSPRDRVCADGEPANENAPATSSIPAVDCPLGHDCADCGTRTVKTKATFDLPTYVYAQNLESGADANAPADEALSADGFDAGARAKISPWTFIGCYSTVGYLPITANLDSPLKCKLECDARGSKIAAYQVPSCSCLESRSNLEASVDYSRCDYRCNQDYFEGTKKFCGGKSAVSVYQKYDMVHQTAQGCYDPNRFIWYQGVAIEHTFEEKSTTGGPDRQVSRIEWYLHASSINSGDPLFPYHQKLDNVLLGLQYDLDNSRLVAYTVPWWGNKAKAEQFTLSVELYRVMSVDLSDISVTKTVVPFVYSDSTAANYLFNTGVTALDAINNIYFITLPIVQLVPGSGYFPNLYSTVIYGINLNTTAGDRVLLKKEVQQGVVLLECNSKYHELFALLRDDIEIDNANYFYYVKLGYSGRNKFSNYVEFIWTLQSNMQDPTLGLEGSPSIVNRYTYQKFTSLTYQVGATAVDHVTNTSFVVAKDNTNANSPYRVMDINQRGFMNSIGLEELPVPQVQATWLVNTDPRIPLTLPAPRLKRARYTLDGRSIFVQFDTFTVQGAIPVDTDGDFRPDDVDWTKQHVGMTNCDKMFSRTTSEVLGPYPQTKCQWRDGATIQIHLARGFTGIQVGDALFLKDSAIYAYVRETNEWSYAASGGIAVKYPNPLVEPTIDISYARVVDLCSAVHINGDKSYGHGGIPEWTWTLQGVQCDGGESSQGTRLTQNLMDKLKEASVGGLTEKGQDIIDIGKDEMEPGCRYTIVVQLAGRWTLSATSSLSIYKKPMPIPQATVIGSAQVEPMRSQRVAVQLAVSTTQCESLLAQREVLKYEWTAEIESENPFTRALENKPVDLSLLNIKTGSATLLIPKLKLEPDARYNMTVAVGYVSRWNIPSSKNYVSVTVDVKRSPIKVNLLGGSRKVQKVNPCAIDATISKDPDYPNQRVEDTFSWEFSYTCTTEDGTACFPALAASTELTDVRDCVPTTETFKELGNTYSMPSFSTEVLRSDSYYCRDKTRNGILILNLPNPQGLQPRRSYTFEVQGTSYGRTAVSAVTLEVTPGQVQGPKVLIDPVAASKVSTTKALKVSGNLIQEDLPQFGNTVSWSWSFFRRVRNPRWSSQQKARVEQIGGQYLVPQFIFQVAEELSDPLKFRSPLNVNNLVVRPGVLQPSSEYSFTLTATAPHPYDGDPLVGYADTVVKTAGPPPVPGMLRIFPENRSVSDQPKTLQALHWTAEDVPLHYMFSYRTDLQNPFSVPVDLRIAASNQQSQEVDCLKAGEAWDDYLIQVNVTVTSLYGASSVLTQMYTSIPPAAKDVAASNANILQRANDIDPESRAMVLNCITSLSAAPPSLGEPEEVEPVDPAQTQMFLPNTATTTTKSPDQVSEEEEQARVMIDLLDQAADQSGTTPESVTTSVKIVRNLAADGTVTDNMVDFVAKMGDSIGDLAEDGEDDEVIDSMASGIFNALGEMGKTTASSTGATGEQNAARSVNLNGAQSGAFFPASSASASVGSRGTVSGFGGGGVRSGVRRLQRGASMGVGSNMEELFPELASAPRRLHGPLDEQLNGSGLDYIVQPGAYPDWNLLPEKFRDPQYTSHRHGFHARSANPSGPQALASMYDQQEALELEWSSYIKHSSGQDEYKLAQAALDDEYFANYSAHLDAGERESVVREWWEERARLESLQASRTYKQAQLTKKTMDTISKISSTIVKFMLTGEIPKDFDFPMGLIRIGKTKDLQKADSSFHLQDPKWTINGDSLGSYGFGSIKFTDVNPMSWSSGAPIGPYLVSSLEVFSEDGTAIPVKRESQPLSIMSDHSSFASASCYYWDWEARDGLGYWSDYGMLNGENGCSSTHLSLMGMFLDVIAPDNGIEILSAVDTDLDKFISEYNQVVVISIGAVCVLIILLHYWGTKQDEADRTKPMEMKKLGDGIRGPRTQDDPVDYVSHGLVQAAKTFWNLLARDHILVACFIRSADQKTTRLQKVSALFAMLCGVSAVAALFYGEHVVDPKHFMEVGIIAAVITYPMVRVILLMFSMRPAHPTPRPDAWIFAAEKDPEYVRPLEAMPIPEGEEDEDEDYGEVASMPVGPQGQLTLPAVRAHSPMSVPPVGHRLVSAPEEGGGPQTGIFPQPVAVEQVLSGVKPPAPPSRPPPPPPPVRGHPFASDKTISPRPASSGGDETAQATPAAPRMPPPSRPPPPLSETLAASSNDDARAAARAAQGLPSSAEPAPDEAAAGSAAARAAMGLPPVAAPAPEVAAGATRDSTASVVSLPTPMNPNPGASPFGPVPQLPGEGDFQLALVEPQNAAAPPPMPPPDSGAAEDQAQTQAQLLRRVRKMYIEKVIRNSERLAFDERVDMKSSVPHPMAQVANAMAYTAVVSFWVTALVLTGVYSVHLKSVDAGRWLSSCAIGWAFTWFVLEFVKAMLVTILELQQLNQRRRIKDHRSLRDQVQMKKAVKMKRMQELAHLAQFAGVDVPAGRGGPLELLPAPPVPPDRSRDRSSGASDSSAGPAEFSSPAQPGRGDASAGF